ncbi:MAG: phosphotransferase [Rhodospirillales bacterium]|nr:phosphotransferase [Rhodospirillales bacterium]
MTNEIPGAGPVRAGHAFDETALARRLESTIPGFHGPLSVNQFDGGQSNPTFHLRSAGGDYVLRKRPPGKLLPSAHAIDREYRVMKALADSDVPVPRMLAYCDDDSVIGTAFYVMDYVPGRILTDPLLPGMPPAERAAIYDAMNDTLARLHRFDWRAAGLADYGRPENYLARQLARWAKQYDATRTEDVPAMDRLRGWLEANMPADEEPTIAHGDFRIGNLVFHPTEPRVLAILDWELSTLGAPLGDLAFNCMTYHLPAGHRISGGFVGADTAALGIPDETSYLDAYCRRTGRDAIPAWRYYMAFSLYRTAAIQQGVYARALQGNASSSFAKAFGESWRMVAETGWALVAAD